MFRQPGHAQYGRLAPVILGASHIMHFATIAAIGLLSVSTAEAQLPDESFTNLRVLPKDISRDELTALMGSFTRALGVRCTYCHVGVQGEPLSTYKFALDDKPTKRTARMMLEMVRDINGRHLAALDTRREPTVKVECATCHRGTTEPRMLQDVLRAEYRQGGVSGLIATYSALRERYYGSFTYDFGEVPLADVAGEIWNSGKPDDAIQLHALNVEMNPKSAFAQRQHASFAITRTFRQDGIQRGTARYRELRDAYGPAIFGESLMGGVGARLLNASELELAIAVFILNVEAFPSSAVVHESLAEAYVKSGDTQRGIASYERALALDPNNRHVKEQLVKLRAAPR
jgi:hypothetical protein